MLKTCMTILMERKLNLEELSIQTYLRTLTEGQHNLIKINEILAIIFNNLLQRIGSRKIENIATIFQNESSLTLLS